MKVILCCSILADDRCFVLRLLLVFVRSVKFAFGRSVYGQSVKFHMSQYLTTDALAPESQYVPRRVSKLCTCITNQFALSVFVVFQTLLAPRLYSWINLPTWTGSFTLCVVKFIYLSEIYIVVLNTLGLLYVLLNNIFNTNPLKVSGISLGNPIIGFEIHVLIDFI